MKFTSKGVSSLTPHAAATGLPVPAWIRRLPVLLTLCLLALPSAAQETVLVEAGSSITYLANSSDPGIGMSWTAESFPDGSWDIGSYGIGFDTTPAALQLINTPVPPGSRSIYTRSTFQVTAAIPLDSLWIGSDHDDGIVAWINGVEVYRSPEMPPSGALDWDTPTLVASESSNGTIPDYTPYTNISAGGLPAIHSGLNSFAVAVWNKTAGSSDLVLVPQLVTNKNLGLIRGPYLQLGTPTSIRVRWRTSILENSRVLYGTDPGALNSVATDATVSLDHDVELNGLLPSTKYYYAVGSGSDIRAGDSSHFFVTAPPTGSATPVRAWVLGDSGKVGANSVRDAYHGVTGAQHTDLWLMLGDNAYPNGSEEDYQLRLFDVFPQMLRQSVLWPTIGNHDGNPLSSPAAASPYFDIFDLPRLGEAGGVNSGSEAYYSFDWPTFTSSCSTPRGVTGSYRRSARCSPGSRPTWR